MSDSSFERMLRLFVRTYHNPHPFAVVHTVWRGEYDCPGKGASFAVETDSDGKPICVTIVSEPTFRLPYGNIVDYSVEADRYYEEWLTAVAHLLDKSADERGDHFIERITRR